jgi:CO dehydrogenase maturation factor
MKTIAISGKGGTGKSTIAALTIRWLKDNFSQPVLAVDADSNVNLNDLLGVEVKESIGSIREEMRRSVSGLPGGMTKQQFLEYKIHNSLVETPGFDLITMGRPEGPGCYCYANALLRDILETLSKNYAYVVIDNEAGMEHLSRRTTQRIDEFLIISDPSFRGVHTAGRIARLLEELDTRIGRKQLILNRIQDDVSQSLETLIQEEGFKRFYSIPEDVILLQMDRSGKAIWDIQEKSEALKAVSQIMQNLMDRG